jgi:hypothetical protein
MEFLDLFGGYSQDWSSASSVSAASSVDEVLDDSWETFFKWGNAEEERENQIPSPLKRKHHAAQRHITGKRRARAELIRSGFDNSPDILRCSDNTQVDCCGLGDDPLPIISYRQGHMWPFAQHEQRLDPVLVAVEVSTCHVTCITP